MSKGVSYADIVPGRIDPGIARAVSVLRAGGVETFESCEGGEDHAFPEPTVRFHGGSWAGYHAFSVAMENGLPVLALRLGWHVLDGHLDGPYWEMTFCEQCPDDGRGD